MDVLGRHNLVTWQRRGGILPQLPAGSLLKYLCFVCFDACVCNESIFVLCLLFCVVCVCVQEGGCMHLLVHIDWLFGFISLLRTTYTFPPRARLNTYSYHTCFLLCPMSLYLYIHTWQWTLTDIPTFPLFLLLFMLRFYHFHPYTQNAQTHIDVFHIFSATTHSHTFVHADTLVPLWPWGLHKTICVGFLQLDFLFSFTLWLSDNLWWPC